MVTTFRKSIVNYKVGFTVRLASKLVVLPVLALARWAAIADVLAGGALLKCITLTGVTFAHDAADRMQDLHADRP